MTTVGFQTKQELTVPLDAYNDDGLAVFAVTGGRYGGEWLINVVHGPAADAQIIGSVWTDRTEDPDVAAHTAWAWIAEECERLGIKVVQTVNHNDRYGPDERPFFTMSQVILADKAWT